MELQISFVWVDNMKTASHVQEITCSFPAVIQCRKKLYPSKLITTHWKPPMKFVEKIQQMKEAINGGKR